MISCFITSIDSSSVGAVAVISLLLCSLRGVDWVSLLIWYLTSFSSPKNLPYQRPDRFRHRTKPLGVGGEQPVIECAFTGSDTVREFLSGHVHALHRIA